MTLKKDSELDKDIQYQKSNQWEKCIICGDSFTALSDYQDHLEHCIDFQDAFNFLDALRRSGVTNMFGSGSYVEREFGVSRKVASNAVLRWMETFEVRHPDGDRDD